MNSEEIKKKKKRFLIIIITIALLIITIDLVLFHTSLEQEGVGRGFSRYWDQEKY